ncbi:Adrenodoxin-like protein [Leptomonas seymouri]|uniref:Adrenodoxin-like protein n=1 Tax=Leptomonas seymouri TaxID=5684 RepID=A0A0N1I5P4_LEPSE|nr:Adrenodoxin-like protein [Leptomonas seymouri]|eukprot:KPI88078.1 Adrenodoxin-like protein [Leptomonas seymouri]
MRRFISYYATCTAATVFGSSTRLYGAPGKVKVALKTQDGSTVEFETPTGTSLMHAIRDVAMLEMEGACDGCMQCSTCHVYVSEAFYKKIGGPSEQEQDVLDKALDLKDTSRLACQIPLTPEVDGIEVELPKSVVNLLM